MTMLIGAFHEYRMSVHKYIDRREFVIDEEFLEFLRDVLQPEESRR